MAKLTVTLNNQPQGEISLDKERAIIGRSRKADLCIDNLAISNQHAVIIKVLDDVFVEDMNSTNGTFVNGQRVQKYTLHDGDRITVGKHVLLFSTDVADIDDPELEKTVLIRPRTAANAASMAKLAERAGGGAEPLATSGNEPQGLLKVLSGPSTGRELVLSKALITIGRPGVQVAAISRRPLGYFITHIESDGDGKRYPTVNGTRIGSRAHPLKNQDRIELAGINLQFVVNQGRVSGA